MSPISCTQGSSRPLRVQTSEKWLLKRKKKKKYMTMYQWLWQWYILKKKKKDAGDDNWGEPLLLPTSYVSCRLKVVNLNPVLPYWRWRAGSGGEPPGFQLPVDLTGLGLRLACTKPRMAQPGAPVVSHHPPPTQTPKLENATPGAQWQESTQKEQGSRSHPYLWLDFHTRRWSLCPFWICSEWTLSSCSGFAFNGQVL